MQLVDQAIFPPYICAVTATSEGPFVDTYAELQHNFPDDPHIYIKASWIETCAAKLFGMVGGDEHAALKRERDELKEQLKQADRLIEAADVYKKRTTRKKEN